MRGVVRRNRAFVLASQALMQMVVADPDHNHVRTASDADVYTLSHGLTAVVPVITVDGFDMTVYYTWVRKDGNELMSTDDKVAWQSFTFCHWRVGQFTLTLNEDAIAAAEVRVGGCTGMRCSVFLFLV